MPPDVVRIPSPSRPTSGKLHWAPATWLPTRAKQRLPSHVRRRLSQSTQQYRKTDSINRGANWSAVRRTISYLMDSKKCFGIIRAALSLLKPRSEEHTSELQSP